MMTRECGDKSFPIWLLGDSEPKNWQDRLDTPFDPRHPIRHNIWTPILDVMQDEIFRKIKKRIDTTNIYIRNAIGDPSLKPKSNQLEWNDSVKNDISYLSSLVEEYKPVIIFSFGSFAYEFGRRALGGNPNKAFRYWNTYHLGDEFRTSIKTFNLENTNLIPLLHRSIAGGNFLISHEHFCKSSKRNYFNYAGTKIAEVIIKNKDSLKIWI